MPAPKDLTFRVRKVRPSEVPLLAWFRVPMMHEIAKYEGRPTIIPPHREMRRYEGWIRREMRRGRLVGFFAVGAEGLPVAAGFVWVQEVAAHPGQTPHWRPRIQSMYTLPCFRGHGAATKILEASIAWAKERGYSQISLRPSPLAGGVYTRRGFEAVPELHLDLSKKPAGRGSVHAKGKGKPAQRAGRSASRSRRQPS